MGKRPVQADFHKPHLFASGAEIVHNLLRSLANAAHGHQDILSVGGAVIVKELIVAAYFGVNRVHVFFYNCGYGIILGVCSLPYLEEYITVLGAAPEIGPLGACGVLAEIPDGVPIHH